MRLATAEMIVSGNILSGSSLYHSRIIIYNIVLSDRIYVALEIERSSISNRISGSRRYNSILHYNQPRDPQVQFYQHVSADTRRDSEKETRNLTDVNLIVCTYTG